MRRGLWCLVVALLALPALPADDKPNDEKPKQEVKKSAPKEQFDALVKEVNAERIKMSPAISKAKGKERQELLQKYYALSRDYASKVYKIAEDNPKDAVAGEAVFWVLQNGSGSPVYSKAVDMAATVVGKMSLKDLAQRLNFLYVRNPKLVQAVFERVEKEANDPAAIDVLGWVIQNGAFGSEPRNKAMTKVATLVGEMPLKDLAQRLGRLFNPDATVLDAVLKRAEKEAKTPQAPELLTWVATRGSYLPAGLRAATTMVQTHLEHPGTTEVSQVLRNARDAKAAEGLLKQVLDKSTKPRAKAAAALSLGEVLSRQSYNLPENLGDAQMLAGEAEAYFVKVIDDLSKEDATFRKKAEDELALLRKFRVGQEAPEITAPDLDKKEFKLSDYRGKVVLLDFWGHW